jgi:hypothetical protein
MRLSYVALLAGWLVVSGGFSDAVEAQCQPPSQEEITAERNALFAEADADDNNVLSPEEFTSFTDLQREARTDHMFTCLDANSDGQVSAEELAAHQPWGGPHPRGPF